jgi:hypothetical protein
LLSRHGFLRDQEGNTGFKIYPPLLKNLRCAGVSNFDQLTAPKRDDFAVGRVIAGLGAKVAIPEGTTRFRDIR